MDIEDGSRPLKRVRTDVHRSNSSATSPLSNMPPLSLSILGVEPVDEFIREVADFIYHMIGMRPRDLPGAMVEVEAKIGILRDRLSGNRLNLPVLTETSEFTSFIWAAVPKPTHDISLDSPLPQLRRFQVRVEHDIGTPIISWGTLFPPLTLDAETASAFQLTP